MNVIRTVGAPDHGFRIPSLPIRTLAREVILSDPDLLFEKGLKIVHMKLEIDSFGGDKLRLGAVGSSRLQWLILVERFRSVGGTSLQW